MEDEILIRKSVAGNEMALEALVKKHQNWVFNTAIIFVGDRDEAQDITQEVLIKMVTKLSTFNRKSEFRTWLYRIIKNHFLNMRRGKYEQGASTFEEFGKALDNTPNTDFRASNEAEHKLIVNEAKISCMNGMLLCLDREQRLIFLLGELFEFPDTVGAEVMEISRENFRVRLHRAKKQLYTFMNGKCGLVNKKNPCRCARKTAGFIKAGCVDPKTLQFQSNTVSSIKEQLDEKMETFNNQVQEDYQKIYQENPFLESPDSIVNIKRFLASEALKSTFNLN